MRLITINEKEYPIKIDNGVLEDFENLTGVNAYEFNHKNFKQSKVITLLALKNADKNFPLSDADVSGYINFLTNSIIAEEFVKACLGNNDADAIKKQVEALNKGQKG